MAYRDLIDALAAADAALSAWEAIAPAARAAAKARAGLPFGAAYRAALEAAPEYQAASAALRRAATEQAAAAEGWPELLNAAVVDDIEARSVSLRERATASSVVW